MYRAFSAAALLCAAAPLPAAPVQPADLLAHIEVLASDAYEGRKPGTAGETKTLSYIAAALARAGLQPAGAGGSWYQPVPLAERRPVGHRALWSANGKPLAFDQDDLVVLGRDPQVQLAGAPVWFAGHGIEQQIAGAELDGAVVLVLFQGPGLPGFPSFSERARTLTEAGAAAVIGVVAEETPWSAIQAAYAQGQNRLGSDPLSRVQGAIGLAAASALIGQAGGDFGEIANREFGNAFRAIRLPLTVDLDVSTTVRAYTSHNVAGRLPGRGTPTESVLLLGHWDHLGAECAATGDRICNGAVDNASGIAMLIEAAERLAQGPRGDRDIVVLATTAEEIGLLGAEQFARTPLVPLPSIVAAINADTVAVAPKGQPVAILNRSNTPLDAIIDTTARELGRTVDADLDANAFIPRQDGWALTRAGVPAIMVGGSFSDLKLLERFLAGAYHKPGDDLAAAIELGGAAEDTDLLVAIVHKLADSRAYQPPAR